MQRPNELQWRGQAGHYEVYYLTLTDDRTGVGIWIRYTMVSPIQPGAEGASCSLWLAATDRRPGRRPRLGRKATYPIGELSAGADPFELRIGGASLTDSGVSGAFEDVAWDLRWTAGGSSYEHIHPVLRKTGLAQTVLVLPHADLLIEGTVTLPDERLELHRARGAQAHLWGSKHAETWAWVHCNDFAGPDGAALPGTFVDAVSAVVERFGREVGPSTPVVGRIRDEDFSSTSPLRVIGNPSTYALTGWRFEAVDGSRKLVGEVDADRDQLVGVTYHDPDGELAYCYNGETASMRLHLYERARRVGGWVHRETLIADGRAHFEYGQRSPVPELELLVP